MEAVEVIPVVISLAEVAAAKQAAYAAKRKVYTEHCLDEFERRQKEIKDATQ
jgi:hypothetical protein